MTSPNSRLSELRKLVLKKRGPRFSEVDLFVQDEIVQLSMMGYSIRAIASILMIGESVVKRVVSSIEDS